MIPKHMERRAWRLVAICVGVLVLSSLVGLMWMSQYAVR